MEFLEISSLGAAYFYVVKIEQKFKHENRRDFGSMNTSQQKARKGSPNMQTKGPRKDNQPPDNPFKSQTKKGNGKTKKDTGKWCELHKSPWHNTDECRAKQSLVAEMKSSGLDSDSDSETEPDKGKQIIDAEPNATVATAQIQPVEPEDPEEGERLFHSQMWVKGAPLHFSLLITEAKRTPS